MAMSKIDRIRELHSPIVPPAGMRMLGSREDEQYCAGCDCGDPYLAMEWPCETREICDEGTKDEETRHIIKFYPKDWTIQHPLACRPNLFECTQPRPQSNVPWELGKFYCGQDSDGEFVLYESWSNPGGTQ